MVVWIGFGALLGLRTCRGFSLVPSSSSLLYYRQNVNNVNGPVSVTVKATVEDYESSSLESETSSVSRTTTEIIDALDLESVPSSVYQIEYTDDVDVDVDVDNDGDYFFQDYKLNDYDNDFDDFDDDDDGKNESDEVPLRYRRDLDLMEMEREDRLNKLHQQRQAQQQQRRRRTKHEQDEAVVGPRNTCVLIGVEDLSLRRKKDSDESQQQQQQQSQSSRASFSLEESLHEMKELCATAGIAVKGTVTQRLTNGINPKSYIGTGKLEEARAMLNANDDGNNKNKACILVVDAELTPGQQKFLENFLNQKILQNDFNVRVGRKQTNDDNDDDDEDDAILVLDRTALILDIFAQHARTREGKLQVDLALHQYRRPRLTRMWTHLERQSGSGGVGLRGPGESQLEIDKRLVRERIAVLQKKIDQVGQRRRRLRTARKRSAKLPVVALVGYTNAGKSTLLNYLTRAGVMAENILFATLDPTTRRVKLPGYKTHPEVLLTDTVGFIQALPTQLVAAFRATLEEVKEADVLLHVIDYQNPVWQKQELSVLSTLRDIGADAPVVRVLNKLDLADDPETLRYQAIYDDSVAVSALTGEGMEDLVALVEDRLGELLERVELVLPHHKGDLLSDIHEQGAVDLVDYRTDGTYVLAKVPQALAGRLRPYQLDTQQQQQQQQPQQNSKDDDIDWVALGRGRHRVK